MINTIKQRAIDSTDSDRIVIFFGISGKTIREKKILAALETKTSTYNYKIYKVLLNQYGNEIGNSEYDPSDLIDKLEIKTIPTLYLLEGQKIKRIFDCKHMSMGEWDLEKNMVDIVLEAVYLIGK